MRAGVFLAAMVVAGSASAQQIDPPLNTTGDLLALCAPPEDAGRRMQRLSYCEGFIAGSGLLYLELRESGLIRQPWACNDSKPTADSVREAFVDWAKANPQAMQEKPSSGFWRAMAAKFPCAAPARRP